MSSEMRIGMAVEFFTMLFNSALIFQQCQILAGEEVITICLPLWGMPEKAGASIFVFMLPLEASDPYHFM